MAEDPRKTRQKENSGDKRHNQSKTKSNEKKDKYDPLKR
jgi:hypothetical protein